MGVLLPNGDFIRGGRREVAIPIGSRVTFEGLGSGAIQGHVPGKLSWQSKMYYWVQLNRFGVRHLFSHEEVTSGQIGTRQSVSSESAS